MNLSEEQLYKVGFLKERLKGLTGKKVVLIEQSDAELEKTMDGALQQVIKKLPKALEKNEEEIQESAQRKPLNEGLGLGLAAVASLPEFTKTIGKLGKKVGQKINSKWVKKISQKVYDVGEKLHEKYIDQVVKAVKKVKPDMEDKKARKIAGRVLTGVIFALALASGYAALKYIGKGVLAKGGVEGVMAAIKSKEVAAEVIEDLPQLVSEYI